MSYSFQTIEEQIIARRKERTGFGRWCEVHYTLYAKEWCTISVPKVFIFIFFVDTYVNGVSTYTCWLCGQYVLVLIQRVSINECMNK